MTDSNQNPTTHVIEAAGGLVWRKTSQGIKIALVHRPRYDDWSFPKGKVDSGEKWHEAALREVFEETGCTVKIREFAGSISYAIPQGIKIVLFWHMTLLEDQGFTPNDEIDQVVWLTPQDALGRLSYEREKTVLSKSTNES